MLGFEQEEAADVLMRLRRALGTGKPDKEWAEFKEDPNICY
jgi:hypothetical protein